jgi:hypothetical protein
MGGYSYINNSDNLFQDNSVVTLPSVLVTLPSVLVTLPSVEMTLPSGIVTLSRPEIG